MKNTFSFLLVSFCAVVSVYGAPAPVIEKEFIINKSKSIAIGKEIAQGCRKAGLYTIKTEDNIITAKL